jgi:hypothetical protein
VEPGAGCQAEFVGLRLTHDQDRGSSVGDLRAVARGHPPNLGPVGGLEVGQHLHRGIRADTLIGGHHLIGVDTVVVFDRYRDDLTLEPTFGGGPGGVLVGPHGEFVEVLPADVPLFGDELGRLTLADQSTSLGVALHHPGPERESEVAYDRCTHRCACHDFHPGGDDDVVGPGHDTLSSEVHRLLG